MSVLVLDASVSMRWVLRGDVPELANRARHLLYERGWSALVPMLLFAEMGNALVSAERRGMVGGPYLEAWARVESCLRNVEPEPASAASLRQACELARRYQLTVYDATYLELALRRRLPLATLDQDLQAAAVKAGVQVNF